jgi:hypothetical protein
VWRTFSSENKKDTRIGYLQGLELKMLGRPTESGNETTVPVGPMTHRMEFLASSSALAAFS